MLSAFSTPCEECTARTRSVSPLLADERKRGADDLLSGNFNEGQHTIFALRRPLCSICYIMDVLFFQ